MNNLSIIVAHAKNRVIGINNTLPWHLPEDLKHFRNLTMGHHIIMGRKTYQSLNRLLPGRSTIIVTRNIEFSVEGAQTVHSIEQALDSCKLDNEPFLIGGEELYKSAFKYANKIYLTEIEQAFEGDAFFPAIDLNDWEIIEEKKHVSENGLKFKYFIYQRKC